MRNNHVWNAPVLFLAILILSCSVIGCTVLNDDTDQNVIAVIKSRNDGKLTDVMVIPLLYRSYGFGAGADGDGFKRGTYVVSEPFSYNSGNNLIKERAYSKFIVSMFPPYAFIFSGKRAIAWMFLKKGFVPIVVTLKTHQQEIPIVMERSRIDRAPQILIDFCGGKANPELFREQFGLNSSKEALVIDFNVKHFCEQTSDTFK